MAARWFWSCTATAAIPPAVTWPASSTALANHSGTSGSPVVPPSPLVTHAAPSSLHPPSAAAPGPGALHTRRPEARCAAFPPEPGTVCHGRQVVSGPVQVEEDGLGECQVRVGGEIWG